MNLTIKTKKLTMMENFLESTFHHKIEIVTQKAYFPHVVIMGSLP